MRGDDPLDAGETGASRVWNAAPMLGTRPPGPVIEGLRAGAERASHDDSSNHARCLVRHTVVVVHAGRREPDLEVIARVHEVSRVPRRRTLRDTERVMIVLRMV